VDINVFIIQIDYVKISCKEDVHICRTNFTKQMERNLHETTSQWQGCLWGGPPTRLPDTPDRPSHPPDKGQTGID
jgi:hypothetical protein